jgi:hypothetical protein
MKNIHYLLTNPPEDIQKSAANKRLKKMHKEPFSLQNLFMPKENMRC